MEANNDYRPFYRNKLYILCSIVVLCCIAGFSIFTVTGMNANKNPLSSFKKSYSFMLYYPDNLPEGFAYKEGSVLSQEQLISYSLVSTDKEITVVEQKKASNAGALKVDGFNSIATQNGTMASGIVIDSPTAIITTDSSLVTIRGTKNTSQSTIDAIGQALRPVN